MSKGITLNLPISVLEELHCFICKGYLSCSPVLLLPNGNYICGRCSPLNTDTPIQRLVPLEALLSKMSFPCMFKKYGCPELLLFGKTAEHESQCVHKHLACPNNTPTTCPWEGNMTQLFQHFEKDHPAFVKDKTELQLELSKDAQGFLMTFERALPFIVKYFYKAKERILQYDVRCCGSKSGHEVSWKIQLINGTDSECSFSLKMNECLSYDESFYNIQNAKVLDISKFLENLGDPDQIVVRFKLKIIKSTRNSVTTEDDCEDLKCNACQYYLVPPLFDLNGKTICYDCSKKNSTCKPSNDTNLLQLVDDATYPCRWRECTFIGKSNIFRDHEINCEFRMYCCVYSSCKDTFFKLCEAPNHLKTHINERVVYISNEIIYKTSFAEQYERKHILTIKNKRIVGLEYKTELIKSNPLHEIRILRSPDIPHSTTGVVHFEHKHCKVISKRFNIPSSGFLKVGLEKLPPCFKKSDELTATVDFIV